MSNVSERSALLLHLGSVLQTLSRICEHERDDETIRELVDSYPILADVPLLRHVLEQMTVREFAAGVLHGFCLWPQLLLDDPLDYGAFASPVRAQLFAGNPHGWENYAATLQPQVPWFGEGVLPADLERFDDDHTPTTV